MTYRITKRQKYGAEKTAVDGIIFDSRKEARRYQELRLFEIAGEIQELRRQVAFNLLPSFRHRGKSYRAIKYVADFVYVEDGREIVEDVKSPATRANRAYRIKLKLLLSRYPQIHFREA